MRRIGDKGPRAALILLALAVSCDAEHRSSPPLPPVSTPIPERMSGLPPRAAAPAAASPLADAPIVPATGPTLPPALAASTPGAIRWRVVLDDAATDLQWSRLGGMLVSMGGRIHDLTSRGVDRWRVAAGLGHRLFLTGEETIVWSPEHGRLWQLLPQGRRGWRRDWSGDVADDGARGPLIIDAATVASVGPGGKDRWRIAMDGLRNLEGPFACEDGWLFHGKRGLEGLAVVISSRGAIVRETALERGAQVIGASRDCNPLIWTGTNIGLLEQRGLFIWRRDLAALPLASPVAGGFLLASAAPDRPVHIESVDYAGTVAWRTDLPLTGRLTRLDAPPGSRLLPAMLALCMDVSSPCARPDGNRGPYNTLLSSSADRSGFSILERHVQGHLALAAHGEGLVIASASAEDRTDVALRDAAGVVLWETTLFGRLSAGPCVGPGGEIYVATCAGWDCAAPFSLFAITGREPLSSTDMDPQSEETP